MNILNNFYYAIKNLHRKQSLGEKKYQKYRENLENYVKVLVWANKEDLQNKDIENGLTDLAKNRMVIESQIIALTDPKTVLEIRAQFETLKDKYEIDEKSIRNIKNSYEYDSLNTVGIILHKKEIACNSMPDEIF